MKVSIVAVGRPRDPLASAIAEFENRARRYFSFDAAEVKAATAGRGRSVARVVDEEGLRLLARIPADAEVVALHREGGMWSSDDLAKYLDDLAVEGRAGATFLIGGAFGLSSQVLERATHVVSLSAFTLPHEMARLVLAEQIYRAGTILRGEPYHKGQPH